MSMGTIPSKLLNDSFQSMKLKPFPNIVLYNKYIAQIYTGLPTTDETSETTVSNLSCLFPYIHDSLQL